VLFAPLLDRDRNNLLSNILLVEAVVYFEIAFGHFGPALNRCGRPLRAVTSQMREGNLEICRSSLARIRLLGFPTSTHIIGPIAISAVPLMRISINMISSKGKASPAISVSSMKLLGMAGINRFLCNLELKLEAGVISA
jgi:hypothetical protein